MKQRLFSHEIILGILIVSSGACSDSKKSTGIPRLITELTTADVAPELTRKTELWERFADAVGIGKNIATTQAELMTQLGTPSAYLGGTKASEYQTLLSAISQEYLKTANGTKCAAVESVTELSQAKIMSVAGTPEDLPGAKAYLMSYKLQMNTDGVSEANARTALLIIPEAKADGGSPLLVYGHGGSSGLSYAEVFTVFGELQKSNIIIAPTFPGEPLCRVAPDHAKGGCDSSGELVAAVGTRSAWDGDADEMLGAHDCALKAWNGVYPLLKIKDTAGVEGLSIGQKIRSVVMTHTGFNTPLPSSLIVGTSRGGLVALLAVARSAAAGKAIAAAKSKLGDGYTTAAGLGDAYGEAPSLFNCAATLAAPITVTAGKSRFGLEMLVRGDGKKSPFYQLPGIADIAPLFDAYAASGSDTDLELLKLDVLKRDATIVGPLILGALHDWTQGKDTGKGALLMLHGTMDKVVGFENMQLGQNIFGAQSQALESEKLAPGVNLYARAFVPTADYLDADGKLKAGVYQHGDAAAFISTAALPSSFISSTVTGKALAVDAAEAYAVGKAKALFDTESPTEGQLAIGRNYILSGPITGLTPSLGKDGQSVIEKTADGIEATPMATFAAWRKSQCKLQDQL